MAGRKKTREKLTKQLEAAGLPPPPRGRSLTPLLEQAKVIADATRAEEQEKSRRARQERDDSRRAAGVEGKSHKARRQAPEAPPEAVEDVETAELTVEDIKKVLKSILMSPREPGAARISAAEKLLQMDGSAPQYQKAILEVRLSAFVPNQYELDKGRSRI